MSENVLFFCCICRLCEPREIPRLLQSLSHKHSPELLITPNQCHDQNPRHSLLMGFTNTDDTCHLGLYLFACKSHISKPRYLLAFCDCIYIYINLVTYFEHLFIQVFALLSLFLFSVSAGLQSVHLTHTKSTFMIWQALI